jgi:uncharacterized membrane protein YedE/YeeE
METVFTPAASFGGGLLIGLGAMLLMLGLGRIFGATGILAGAVFVENREEMSWRLALLAGMILAPSLIFAATGAMPALTVTVSPIMIAVGGVIVGLGASLGSGCTSGHGVCGLSRMSAALACCGGDLHDDGRSYRFPDPSRGRSL